MKFKLFTLVLFVTLSFSALAQEKRSVALSFSSFGSVDIINSARQSLLGEASYTSKHFFTLGVSYVQPIRKWIGIESGVEYSNHIITVEPMSQPGMTLYPYNKEISLVNIPVTAQINFLKYFFINGGVMLNLETGTSSPIDSQTGIGSLFGIGAKYTLNNGLGAFVNGYSKFYSLVPLSAKSDDHRWRLTEGGLRIGLTYSF